MGSEEAGGLNRDWRGKDKSVRRGILNDRFYLGRGRGGYVRAATAVHTIFSMRVSFSKEGIRGGNRGFRKGRLEAIDVDEG